MKLLTYLNNLSIKTKLWAIMATIGVPLVISTWLLLASINEKIHTTESEIEGVSFLAPVAELIESVAQHRGLLNGYLNGADGMRGRVIAAQSKVDATIAEFSKLTDLYGDRLGTRDNWEDILGDWKLIKSDFESMEADAAFQMHSNTIAKIQRMAVRAADKSSLIVDPQLDSYYTMDMVVNNLPKLLGNLGIMRGSATGVAAAGELTEAKQFAISAITKNVELTAMEVEAAVATAIEVNPESISAGLGAEADAFQQAVRDFRNIVDAEIMQPDVLSVAPTDIFSSGTDAVNAAIALYAATSETLLTLLHTRLDGLVATRYEQMGFITLLLALGCGLCVWIVRSVSLQAIHARDVLESIREGNLNNEVLVRNQDELGGVLDTLSFMQDDLRERIEEERRLSSSNGRIRQALQAVTANVMMVDENQRISFVNPSLIKLLHNAEADIRRDVPAFDSDSLVDENLSIFSGGKFDLVDQLQGCRDSRELDFVAGGRTMHIISSPVFDQDENYIGAVLEWVDRTFELEVENEIHHIVSASLEGDLTKRIGMQGKQGFAASLSQGVNDLLDLSERVVGDTMEVLGAMAKGDLTKSIEGDYSGSFGKLKSDTNATLAKLIEVMGEISGSAHTVMNGSLELSQGNTNLSQRTEEQAASLEETASSMEEMTSTVRQNADNALQANQLASGARDQAVKGGEVVSNAVSAMSEITESSKKISDIIGVIDEIAFQTNLLALNAAVEAARAGDQGRGFAVVASEVRNLAGRSATAAKEIKDLIQDSVLKVEEGSKLVHQSGETLDEIMKAVSDVSDIVGSIASASREQSEGIEQVNRAVAQMDESTQQNAALVEQAAAASEAMGDQARGLNELVGFFEHGADSGVQAPAVERRQSDRPWSGSGAHPQAVSNSEPALKVAGGHDDDWEEF